MNPARDYHAVIWDRGAFIDLGTQCDHRVGWRSRHHLGAL